MGKLEETSGNIETFAKSSGKIWEVPQIAGTHVLYWIYSFSKFYWIFMKDRTNELFFFRSKENKLWFSKHYLQLSSLLQYNWLAIYLYYDDGAAIMSMRETAFFFQKWIWEYACIIKIHKTQFSNAKTFSISIINQWHRVPKKNLECINGFGA